jgi:predicted nucleic acid-binding protein
MKYLLDTDTLIDFIQDRGDTRSRIVAMLEGGDEVGLCAVTVAELYSGLSEQNHVKWQAFMSTLPYWDVTRDGARQAGIDRKVASATGRTMQVADSLIAAVAREQQAVVLTSNIKDYLMKDVRVLSLREKAA